MADQDDLFWHIIFPKIILIFGFITWFLTAGLWGILFQESVKKVTWARVEQRVQVSSLPAYEMDFF